MVPATAVTSSTRTPTGVAGFDEITRGGLPAGRITLLMGGAGTGKTICALHTLVQGGRQRKEPGLFVVHHRVAESTAIRTLRVAKLRGAAHSAGIEIAGGAAREIEHEILLEKVSTGISRMDKMLGDGYFRGSSILISGVPGTAKTTLAAAFAEAACRRGERTLFVSSDEAPQQIVRNLESVRIRLHPHRKSGLLQLCGLRTRSSNAESHISHIWSLIREHVSALLASSGDHQVQVAIIDVFDHPDLALEDQVFLTPMLVRLTPLPKSRVIGNLNDREIVLQLSGLRAGRVSSG